MRHQTKEKHTMKHLHGNQYEHSLVGHLYDIEAVILYVDLADFCRAKFGLNIVPSDKICELAKKLRGIREYGNNAYIHRFEVRGYSYKSEFELLEKYKYDGLDCMCTATWGDKKEDWLLNVVSELHEYFLKNDIMEVSFVALMGRWDMPYICNRESVANSIMDWYKPYVEDQSKGVAAYLNKIKAQ